MAEAKCLDGNMSELISTATVTTRKTHICFGCNRDIPRGNVMNVMVCVDGGEIYRLRQCEICDEIARHLDCNELVEGYTDYEMSEYPDVNTPAELLAELERQ